MSDREQELERRIAELESEAAELKKTKELLAARTAVAWVGMVHAARMHSISGYASNIRNTVMLLLRNYPGDTGPINDNITKRLELIANLAARILEEPITPPLSPQKVSIVSVNALLLERIRQLQSNEPYREMQVIWRLGPDNECAVRANPYWLRRAVDILFDNAVDAMAGSARKTLVISTAAVSNTVTVEFSDSGGGILEEIKLQLFMQPIEKPQGSKGLGIGLLLASTIVNAYGGDIRLSETSSHGATFIISLPLAK